MEDLRKIAATKGPWEAKGPGVFAGSDCIGICDTDNAPMERMEANAKLMAAAPDLLQALKALFHEHDQTYDGEGMSIELFRAWEMTRAAIAKAEGR